MKEFKFYIVVKIDDFQNWKNTHTAIWQNWRSRFTNAFDITESCRKSNNNEYAIIENKLSYFTSRTRIATFENLITGFNWIRIFPYSTSTGWTTAGYNQSIFDLFNQYPNLWNPPENL